MKNKHNTRILVLLLAVFLNFYSFGQVNNNKVVDSSAVVHIEPKAVPADLSAITPPEGFEVSDKFHGYISLKMGTAMLMTQINDASFVILKKAMTDDYFEKNHLTKISEKDLTTDSGMKGIIYKCAFRTQKTDFIRYIVYAGDLNKTLWLNITYPKMVEELMEPAILKSIKTLHFVTKPKK